jgi:hypothetical protein
MHVTQEGDRPVSFMAENRKSKDQGLYNLSRRQLGILAVGFTVTSAIIFFLGILIGQGIEERKLLKREEPIAKIPIRPMSQGSSFATGAPVEQEMTFYDTLTQLRPGVEAKTTAEGSGGKPQGKTVKSNVKKTKPSVKVKTATLPKGAQKSAVPKAKKAGSVWSVQVNAFKRQNDARRLTKRLKDKGYDAFVVSTKRNGRIWYRVRVGHLATKNGAKRLLEKLQKKEKFTKAILARTG